MERKIEQKARDGLKLKGTWPQITQMARIGPPVTPERVMVVADFHNLLDQTASHLIAAEAVYSNWAAGRYR